MIKNSEKKKAWALCGAGLFFGVLNICIGTLLGTIIGVYNIFVCGLLFHSIITGDFDD